MNITKESNEMYTSKLIVQDKEDLEKALELLKESVYLINLIPNRTYDGPIYRKSYELASAIDKFLNEIK